MAICMVFTPPKGDGFPPTAMKMHLMGTTDAGEIRIVDIFESAEEFQKFAEAHAPVYAKMGLSLDDVLKHASVFRIEKNIQK